MSEHTKTPWKIDKELGSRSGEWLIAMDAGDKGQGIAIARTVEGSGQELKNALTIVHRVNAYERLVGALELAQDAMTVFDTGCGFMRDEFDFSEDRLNIAILLKELELISE